MRDEQLLEAIERYLNGDMGADERRAFEQLRIENAEVDQRVIEHQQFVGLLKQYGERVELETRLNTIHEEIDVHTLTEAAESLGAGSLTILLHVILPNLRAALAGGAFLTFAIVIGEFTIASLLARPAFGPYLVGIGTNRAYEPAALAIISFIITWGAMGMINVLGRFAPRTSARTD